MQLTHRTLMICLLGKYTKLSWLFNAIEHWKIWRFFDQEEDELTPTCALRTKGPIPYNKKSGKQHPKCAIYRFSVVINEWFYYLLTILVVKPSILIR